MEILGVIIIVAVVAGLVVYKKKDKSPKPGAGSTIAKDDSKKKIK